ncbi:hypothetical protein NQ318_010017 [Aromia moschata]|uniref:Uncharacterized protein n=1 Tax=Aromia moschata TaxID=1265417 RepID=A0AAV8Y8J3_9CUCU|nr:hypothetical protein NQ318_010017 [Aromia moschata]
MMHGFDMGLIDIQSLDTTTTPLAVPLEGEVKTNEKPLEKNDAGRSLHKKRRRFNWQKGYVLKKKKKRLDSSQMQVDEKLSSDEDSKDNETKTPPEQCSSTSNGVHLPETRSQEAEINTEFTFTPLIINCDTQSNRFDAASPLYSPRRRLNDLLSPSELLDNPLDFDDVDQALNERVSGMPASDKQIECSQPELEKVLEQTVKLTEGYTLVSLLDLYNQLSGITKRYSRTHLRTNLPKDILKELSRFKEESGVEYQSS